MDERFFGDLMRERADLLWKAARRGYARVRPVPPDGRLHMDGTYTTGLGEHLVNVHPKSGCTGRSCVIHGPSDHGMRGFPTHWRGDRALMERICPHGVGHPDPDDAAFQEENFPGRAAGVHGCDGCCSGKRFTD